MKTHILRNLTHRRLRRLVGACFGLFNVRRAKARRANAGAGCMTVISGTRGIYFVPCAPR